MQMDLDGEKKQQFDYDKWLSCFRVVHDPLAFDSNIQHTVVQVIC